MTKTSVKGGVVMEKMQLKEFIHDLIDAVNRGDYLEDIFFDYLETYNPLLLEKTYPLYTAEGDFFLAIKEGLRFTENEYEEHLLTQIASCEDTDLDYLTVLEDTLYD